MIQFPVGCVTFNDKSKRNTRNEEYLKVELEQRLTADDLYRTSVEVLEKARDPGGNQRILLKTIWKNVIPDSLQAAANLNIPEIEFEEEFWIDSTEQGYWRRCRNVTLEDMLQIWQASSCSIDQNNNNWTYSEEEGGVEAMIKNRIGMILENTIGKFIENCIKKIIEKNEGILAQFYDE